MFLTKKHLSRRTLLKGAGVSLALPLLDAMIPAATALAQTAAARKLHVGFFYIPHGAVMYNTKYGARMDRWSRAVRARNSRSTRSRNRLSHIRSTLPLLATSRTIWS